MIEDIKMLKEKVLQHMDQEIGKYGNGRMDVKQIGDLADVVKDLAEAEYYCTVAESMGGSQGYTQPRTMGYQGQGGMGGGRQGYGTGSMGHTDPMQVVRDVLASNPELRSQLRNELM